MCGFRLRHCSSFAALSQFRWVPGWLPDFNSYLTKSPNYLLAALHHAPLPISEHFLLIKGDRSPPRRTVFPKLSHPRSQHAFSCVFRRPRRAGDTASPASMDNYGVNYPEANPNMNFDTFWESYDGQLASSLAEARPTQPAPFFQFSGRGNAQKTFTTEPIPVQASTFTLKDLHETKRPCPPNPLDLAQRRRLQSDHISQIQPTNKRQKLTHPTTAYADPTVRDMAAAEDGGSVADLESECCSSCSDGIPCASPDCAPCSEPGCNSKTIEVIPCNKKECEQPACTEQCLSAGIRSQHALLSQGVVPRERVISSLIETPWNHQKPRLTAQLGNGCHVGIFDPALKVFDGHEYTSQPASPAPTTPSIGHNMPTPYSPNAEMPTPQLGLFPSQNLYSTQSENVLSGTGTMFNSLSQTWPEQSFNAQDHENGASMFQCPWDGCYLPFPSHDDWLPHLHKDHVDPQMIFGCPIQAETCPQTIRSNPLDHLQLDHGFNFDLNNNNFSCPAPNCLATETFGDPAMLHDHFDHAHATPAQGGLRCRLEKTCDFFGDYDELFSHINEQHPLPPLQKDDEINLSLPTARINSLQQEHPTDEGILSTDTSGVSSSEEPVHCCMWKADDQVCGLMCQSEVELQTHIKCSHLDSLDKRSGYRCLWEDCKRKEMSLEKQGFSQRGKLERHMATHTNCKQIVFLR